MAHKIQASVIRQFLVLALLIFVLIIIAREMLPYLGGVLGAVTLYVLLIGFQKKLESYNWKPALAAGSLIIVAIIVILLPIVSVTMLFSSKVEKAIKNSQEITETVKSELRKIEDAAGFSIADNIDSAAISSWISKNIQSLASSSLTIFISVGIMLFLLYYMLVARKAWQKALVTYLPLKKENLQKIGKESLELVKSNAIGIPMVALLQGIIALIGYFIFSVENPFFWFVITVIGSMIPFVGTALGILPVCILLFSQGETTAAIGLLIYGGVVVGSTDNLFRLVVQRKLADVHPLVTLIGVVVGVPLFGFIGLIFGPLLVSLLLLLIKIYKTEYGKDGAAI